MNLFYTILLIILVALYFYIIYRLMVLAISNVLKRTVIQGDMSEFKREYNNNILGLKGFGKPEVIPEE